ncbi:hypothetical protein GCM10009676_19500 [Prauserella halophila]|uniref:PPE family protein n=1 Tax=Prauserella halophila TaxID=185641 RepID=A0ABP4GRL2_9PSEU|nr:hypothetical protein [Prauserella halophila]MCP2235849.1 PPE family protein [Prauserella halophila]
MSMFDGVDFSGKGVFDDLFGDAGVLATPEAARRIRQGNSGPWHQVADQAGSVASDYNLAATDISSTLQKLESAWSGQGSDIVSTRLKDATKALDEIAEGYAQNQFTNAAAGSTYDSAKNTMPDISDKEPQTNLLNDATPWDTDTEGLVNQRNAQLAFAQQKLKELEGHSTELQGSLIKEYPDVPQFAGDGSGARKHEADIDSPRSSTDVIDIPATGNDADSRSADSTGNHRTSTDPTAPAPSYTTADNAPDAAQPNDHGPGTGTPTYPAPGDDSTGTSAVTPPSTAVPPVANHPTSNIPGTVGTGTGAPGGPNPPGFGPVGTRAPGTPGLGTGGGVGGGGRVPVPGVGATGGGSGIGGGAGAAPGAGKMTGATPGTPGSAGPTSPGGTSASTTAAGGRGGAGMMGGAGRGGNGNGNGNEEHQRKYVADTDEHFDLTENDEVLRDPETGRVVTPPVIGE